jgi:hypothetical protein
MTADADAVVALADSLVDDADDTVAALLLLLWWWFPLLLLWLLLAMLLLEDADVLVRKLTVAARAVMVAVVGRVLPALLPGFMFLWSVFKHSSRSCCK